LANLKKIKKG
jgi:hypothetical protein